MAFMRLAAAAWEPFSDVAKNLIVSAQQVAVVNESQTVRTEHFLLAILNDSDSAGSVALKNVGVDFVKLRKATGDACRSNTGVPEPDSVFSPHGKRTIELAFECARKLGHNYIGTGHLLIGLMECPESQAGRIIANFKVNHSQLLEEVAKFEGLEQPYRFNLRKSLSNGFQKLWEQIKNF
jgi:ATP-dependent Clp protease ATP-binding subunit ClpC